MLIWKLRTLYARAAGNPLVKDVEGKFVTARGIAYLIERMPATGRLGAVEVNLLGEEQSDGSAVVRGTRMPGLTTFCADTPLAVEAAIRMLLWRADRETLRMERIAAEIGFVEQEEQVEPEAVFTQEDADFITALKEHERRERQEQLEEQGE